MKRILYRHILLLFAVAACVSCSPHSGGKLSLRQAQHVVAQADSLWQAGQMYGVDAGDSTTLAQAYETLNSFVHCTPSTCTSFAHACYHYGRLLRAKENPVEAMQAFIAATHSRTRDYHILGRVYSNMGSICHLASEFQLSYDMYEKSAEKFLKNGDTLNYYYALNEMAFELAEQGDKDEAFSLLSKIEKQYLNSYLYAKIWETKADAFLCVQQYDSTIYCINQLNSMGFNEPMAAILMAQAYDNLGLKDSALLYARTVLADPYSAYQDKFNALYIVSHLDSTLNAEEISELASQREDIRFYEYEPQKEKLNQSVQLLEQDLNRKPDLRWLYAIIVTVVIIGISLFIYIFSKRKRKKLLVQQLANLEQETENMQEKHNDIASKYILSHQRIEEDILNRCRIIRSNKNIAKYLTWTDFNKMADTVDQQFYMLVSKLHQQNVLNETEIRLCVLVLIGLRRDEISQILPYALSGIGKLKDQTAKKLGTTGKNLYDFLLKLAVEK